jgi:predicted metal-dependent hydrolase
VAAILKQKRPWIRGKVAELKRVQPHRPKELVSGESFPYLGRNYRLKVQDGHQVGVCLSGGYLRATVRPTETGQVREARIKQYIQNWYRSRSSHAGAPVISGAGCFLTGTSSKRPTQ